MTPGRHRFTALSALGTVLAAGCLQLTPGLPDIREGPPTVAVRDVTHQPLEAVLPTDLIPLRDGEVVVVDGYAQRLLVVGGADSAPEAIQGDPAWGHPVRGTTRSDGGPPNRAHIDRRL